MLKWTKKGRNRREEEDNEELKTDTKGDVKIPDDNHPFAENGNKQSNRILETDNILQEFFRYCDQPFQSRDLLSDEEPLNKSLHGQSSAYELSDQLSADEFNSVIRAGSFDYTPVEAQPSADPKYKSFFSENKDPASSSSLPRQSSPGSSTTWLDSSSYENNAGTTSSTVNNESHTVFVRTSSPNLMSLQNLTSSSPVRSANTSHHKKDFDLLSSTGHCLDSIQGSNSENPYYSPASPATEPSKESPEEKNSPRQLIITSRDAYTGKTMASALPDLTSTSATRERDYLGPEVEWEQDNLTMEQLIEMDIFPCLCCFEEQQQAISSEHRRLSAGLKIYSHQPVLMHMPVKKKQAKARTIFKDPRGAYYEVGQTMIIPDDYQGWFELVPSDYKRASCYLSIAEVAEAMPRKFFTRSNVKGIRVEGEGENQKYMERKILAGSVLETKGTFTAKWKTQAETGLFKKKTTEWEHQVVTYLKCLDSDGQEILVPMTHKGKFNAIYERGQLARNAVYSMKDILTDLSLPIKARLLFGKAPVVPCIFTGMLVIRSSSVEESVVGSTVLNSRNVLFEIPINAPVLIKSRTLEEPFDEMTTYKDAKKLCKKYAGMYSSMIKLSPDLDTDQKVIMHVPSDPSVMREADESLRALDLITDISLTGDPKSHMFDSSDSSSMSSTEQGVIIPQSAIMTEVTAETDYKSQESHTHV